MPIGEDITIPESVLVRCPLHQFSHRRARLCDNCMHFRGLAEQRPGSSAWNGPAAVFQRCFSVRCAWPIERELSALVEDSP